ncbi:unnamed protein product (macronuclear) [Paramecium tetraurelia]|uniref:Uncharacterized protein n=1 Tax=Paramecium tetraurelia TaxID=5888 RepID=A0CZI5_PARTE|nr:uncharacterized protein GSPATT00011775001 [Paramecium tetraurelia]CAK76202.1 unnamed protein product [Paramecium tetraurelia]|eukprot:XP_001443599.1 hypothetical protein (macronuclear) [Paramecium tetraurelia strain d4-2]
MLKIQRSKSCDAILITLKNLDKGDNQSQQSFRVYENSTILDLIVHINKSQQTKSDIKLYFEQNIQFTGDLNQYLIDIIKKTKNRSIGYRLIEQHPQTKSEYVKINQYTQSEIYPEKRIIATQIPSVEQYNPDLNINTQNQVVKNQLRNKENYEEERSQRIDNFEQFKQMQEKASQYQQFSQLVSKTENIHHEQQQSNHQQSMSQNYKNLEIENQKLKDAFKTLQNQNQILAEENNRLKIENQILKVNQNNQQVKQISPVSERQENKLHETTQFTNKCKHQIKEKQLEQIFTQALLNKQFAKCPQCNQNISNKLCQQFIIFGRQYLDMKNQMDLYVLSENIQQKLRQNKEQSLVRCSSKNCNFICIWQQNLVTQKQLGFCPICLSNSLGNPQIKGYRQSNLLLNKGTK